MDPIADDFVPEHERHLFEQAELFWRARRTFDNYNDRNTFFTLAEDVPVDAALEDYETFRWRGYEFFVLPAKGHTLGSSMLLAKIDGRLVAFTGDLLAAGGKLYQLHAMEFTYGAMEGVVFTLQSLHARVLEHQRAHPNWVIGDPPEEFSGTLKKLRKRGVVGSLWEYAELLQRFQGIHGPSTAMLPTLPAGRVNSELVVTVKPQVATRTRSDDALSA